MRLNSEYFDETLEVSNSDLESMFNLYEQWCDDNFQNTECSKDEFIQNPVMFLDHILYHAEIVNSKKVNDFINKNKAL